MGKDTIGLITYHAAYNFGSVLQAYATQYTLQKLGYQVEIIDYRTPSQTLWYTQDITLKKGKRSLIEAPFFLRVWRARKRRARKFEVFMSEKMNLTPKTHTCFDDFKDLSYPILISGSDQVWNFKCGEFRFEPWDAIRPYFLDFGNPKKRIAYASSFGMPTEEYVRKCAPYLEHYDSLSTREPIGKRFLECAINRPVTLVADPTWLLDKDQWSKLLTGESYRKPYILIYSLSLNWRHAGKWLRAVKNLADKKKYSIYCISPLHPLIYPGIKMVDDAGPLDFLSLIKDAKLVVTNTFHGTIFSMNFEVPFISCEVKPNSRQGQILAMCGLSHRIANSPQELAEFKQAYELDFSGSTARLIDLRNKSVDYLKNALNDDTES